MNIKLKRASKNEEFIKKIKKDNDIKTQEYKMWVIEDINSYINNEQEYYYSVR